MKNKSRSHLILGGLLVILVSAGSNSIVGADTTWIDATGSWFTPGNWTNGVPTPTVDAITGDANLTGPNQPSLIPCSSGESLTTGTDSIASTLTVGKPLIMSSNIFVAYN